MEAQDRVHPRRPQGFELKRVGALTPASRCAWHERPKSEVPWGVSRTTGLIVRRTIESGPLLRSIAALSARDKPT